MKTNKHITSVALYILFPLFLLLAGYSGGISSQESSSTAQDKSLYYVALQAVAVLADEIVNRENNAYIIPLSANMNDQLTEHISLKKSREKSVVFVDDLLINEFHKKRNEIYENFGLANTNLSKDQFEEIVTDKLQSRINSNAKEYLSKNLTTIFDKARNASVKKQAEQLNLSAYPSQKRANEVDKMNWDETAIRVLKADIVASVQDTAEVLFEENRVLVENIADKIVDDIRGQHSKQRTALMKTIPASSIYHQAIAAALYENVSVIIGKIRAAQTDNSVKVYNRFPSIGPSALNKAKEIELERWHVYLEKFQIIVDDDHLVDEIYKNLSIHRLRLDSSAIFKTKYIEESLPKVVSTYTAAMGTSSNIVDFRNRLTASLQSETSRSILRTSIDDSLQAPLETARGKIARQQLERHFKPVATGEWQPPENILKQVLLDEYKDFKVDKNLQLPFISKKSEPFSPNHLLEESSNLTSKMIGALFIEARTAWNEQLKMVFNNEKQLLKALEKEDLKGEDYWKDWFKKHVEDKWSEARVNLLWRGYDIAPDYAQYKYSPLFGYVKARIDEKVHSFFEAEIKRREKLKKESERIKQEKEQRLIRIEQAKLAEQERIEKAHELEKQQEAQKLTKISSQEVKAGDDENGNTEEAKNAKDSMDTTDAEADKSENSDSGDQGEEAGEGENTGPGVTGGAAKTFSEMLGDEVSHLTKSNKWWWLILLFLLILLIVLLVFLIYQWRKVRPVFFEVDDLDYAERELTKILKMSPTTQTETELCYEKERVKLVLKKLGSS